MSLLSFFRPAQLVAGLTLVLASAAFNPASAAVIVEFTANCSFGCTGQASATVTLLDSYVPGGPLTLSDITQLDFSSNSVTFSMAPPNFLSAGSTLPISGASFFDVADGVYEFFTFVDGNWAVSFNDGFGYSHVAWGHLGDFQSTPEPTSVALIGAGLAGIAALRRRKA